MTTSPEMAEKPTDSSSVDHEVKEPQDSVINNTEKPSTSGTRQLKGITWYLVVASILAPHFLFALDNTIVADVQPKIVESLGEIDKLPWVSVAFALGAVSVNLIWGKMYGQFNTKYLFLGSVLIFEVGSVVCGSAKSMNALIVGRAICGLGGAGLYLGCINILSIHTTESERPAYLGLVGLIWGLGTVLGPIIGGAFADSKATWRWSFYVNLCIGGAGAPALLLLLPSHDPRPGVKITTRVSEIDILGAILVIGGFASLIMGIQFGGVTYPWRSGQIIALFVVAGVVWIFFVIQQSLCIATDKTRRLFPVECLMNYELVILFVQTAASITSCFLPIYFLPLFFQFAQNDSAFHAAVRLLPFVFVLVFAVIFNGVLMGKFGYYMPWYTAGGILIVIGSSLMYTIDFDSSASRVEGYSVLIALGTGLYSQASFPVAQARVEPHLLSAATAFIACGQVGGLAIALSISNAVFLNQATKKISQSLPGADLSGVRQAITGAGGKFFDTLSEPQRVVVLTDIVASINDVWIMVIVAGALSVVLSIFMKRDKLFSEDKVPDAIEGNPLSTDGVVA